jgi:hypothetical protein
VAVDYGALGSAKVRPEQFLRGHSSGRGLSVRCGAHKQHDLHHQHPKAFCQGSQPIARGENSML